MRGSFSTNIVDVQKVWFWTFFRQSYIKYHFSWEWFIGSHSSSVFQECNRNRSFDCLDSAWRYHYVFVLVQLKSVFIKIWEVIAVFTYCAVGKAWRSEYRRYVSEKKDVMEDTLFSYPWWDGRWCWKRTQMNAFCTTVQNQLDQICLTCLNPLKSNVFHWRRKQKWRK